MGGSDFTPAPHLQNPGSAQALLYKDSLKATVLANGGTLPGHAGVAALAAASGVDMRDQAAMTTMLAQAVGAPEA